MTGRWLVRRLLRLVLLLFGVSVLCFALVALSPTDPAVYVLRRGNLAVTPEALAEVRAELGLDLPLALRYLHWLGGVLTGDLGTSIASGNAVAADLAAAIPTTLSLAALAFVEAIVLTLLAGFVAALERRLARSSAPASCAGGTLSAGVLAGVSAAPSFRGGAADLFSDAAAGNFRIVPTLACVFAASVRWARACVSGVAA